ncbi:MAG: hypothetical protein AB7F31_00655 [Parachlamydiales bacterium]
MGKLTGLLLAVGLVSSAWANEPIICEVGDYIQYRQELAKEAHRLKEIAKQKKVQPEATPQVVPEATVEGASCAGGSCDLDHMDKGLLAGQTWGGRGTPGDNQFFGRSKKSEWGIPLHWGRGAIG